MIKKSGVEVAHIVALESVLGVSWDYLGQAILAKDWTSCCRDGMTLVLSRVHGTEGDLSIPCRLFVLVSAPVLWQNNTSLVRHTFFRAINPIWTEPLSYIPAVHSSGGSS